MDNKKALGFWWSVFIFLVSPGVVFYFYGAWNYEHMHSVSWFLLEAPFIAILFGLTASLPTSLICMVIRKRFVCQYNSPWIVFSAILGSAVSSIVFYILSPEGRMFGKASYYFVGWGIASAFVASVMICMLEKYINRSKNRVVD